MSPPHAELHNKYISWSGPRAVDPTQPEHNYSFRHPPVQSEHGGMLEVLGRHSRVYPRRATGNVWRHSAPSVELRSSGCGARCTTGLGKSIQRTRNCTPRLHSPAQSRHFKSEGSDCAFKSFMPSCGDTLTPLYKDSRSDTHDELSISTSLTIAGQVSNAHGKP